MVGNFILDIYYLSFKRGNKWPVWLGLCLILSGACGSKCVKSNSPVIPYFTEPDKEAFKVGDTIWLEARMPHVLKDWETGEYNNYEKVDFNSYFDIEQLTDTNVFIFGSIDYATRKFGIKKVIGDYRTDGDVCRITYQSKNDSFFFKVALVPKDSGLYYINLAFNPGSTAHGKRKIDLGDKSCEHNLSTLCQSFNNGHSTLYRAKDRGFKVHYSPYAGEFEHWIYNNRMYFFFVKK